MAEKNNCATISVPREWSRKIETVKMAASETIASVSVAMHDCLFHHALNSVWKLIAQVNAYFHEQEPWKQAK